MPPPPEAADSTSYPSAASARSSMRRRESRSSTSRMRPAGMARSGEGGAEGGDEGGVVGRVDRPQVEEEPSLAQVADDRRLALAQAGEELGVAGEGQGLAGDRRLGSGAAPQEGLGGD